MCLFLDDVCFWAEKLFTDLNSLTHRLIHSPTRPLALTLIPPDATIFLTTEGGWYQFSGRGKSGDDAHVTREIQKKQNKYGGTKNITYKVVFLLH